MHKELEVTRRLLELKTDTLNDVMDESEGLEIEIETLERTVALKSLGSIIEKWRNAQV